ncbi:MAG: butyrate kinase [Treponemataceae bacterium]
MEKELAMVINLGSTSSKVGVYDAGKEVFKTSVPHDQAELSAFSDIWAQQDFRKRKIMHEMSAHGIQKKDLSAVVSRGGNIRPVPGGIYVIDIKMLADIRGGKYGVHPTGLGVTIAFELGKELGIPALTRDPPVTDEFWELSRYSGIKELPRVSSFHALSQKATAKKACANVLGKAYEEANLIVAHLGGGISVGTHFKGRIVDVNNALDGEGPFSPERAGTVPAGDLVRMCFSGKYTEKEIIKKLKGEGGLMSYLGTNSGIEVERRIAEGDTLAREVYEAMAYRISKEIGAAAANLEGKVDAVIMTGSLAYSKTLVAEITKRVSFIARVILDPGENEMQALADGAHRYLTGAEAAREY